MSDPFAILLFYIKISVAATAEAGHGVVAEVMKSCHAHLVSRKTQILIVIACVTVRLSVTIFNTANAKFRIMPT